MKEFRGSPEHYEALQDAIQNGPEYLACDKMGVSISSHIDFGLKHTGVTLYSLTSFSVFKKDVPNLSTTIMWTSIFEWYVVRCGSKYWIQKAYVFK
jgi:hypothetical protein